jgi:hypothetical protein
VLQPPTGSQQQQSSVVFDVSKRSGRNAAAAEVNTERHNERGIQRIGWGGTSFLALRSGTLSG